ncbi:MAG: DUF2878 domain-containing protein [Halieaceae bacterium]|jgi:hypothetical protein|nr:DUF2878 domain-containing protein [Halieaceae bacterium]
MTSRFADSIAFNALWFQALWFSTVVGREQFLPLAVALLCLHLWLVHDYRAELRQLAIIGGLGIGADAALSVGGVFEFSGSVLIPLWLCCLWLAFAAVLGRSLAWVGVRPLAASLAGAIAFPLNYWAGLRLGAVEFGYSLPATMAILAVTWAVLLPLMFRLTARLAPVAGTGGAAS